jgi:hypothetical protein
MTMRKQSKAALVAPADLRPEYVFDYSKARPNPYAERLRGKTVAVVLDAEVAAAFPTSESVNTALRSVMGLVRRRSLRRPNTASGRRSNNQMQRTRSAKTRRRGPRR